MSSRLLIDPVPSARIGRDPPPGLVGDGRAHLHRGHGVRRSSRRTSSSRARATAWPPPGIPAPELHRTVLFSVVLLGSSIPIFWTEHALGVATCVRWRSRWPWRS